MNRHARNLIATLATTWVAATASAQFYPLPPPAYAGLTNTTLRASDPYMAAWDFGVNIRGRMEDKDNAGFTSAGQNRDFSGGRPVNLLNGDRYDNNNTYFITRIMPRAGYTGKWYQLFLQARSSSSFDDERGNNGTTFTPVGATPGLKAGDGLAENDSDLNLHQAYVFVGNHKEFPVSLKIGRQELVYGDQRQVGNFLWNNNARTFDAVKVRYQSKWVGADLFSGGVVYNDDGNFNKSHLDSDKFSGAYLNFPTLSRTEIVEGYLYSRNVDRASTTEDWGGVAAPFRQPYMQDLYTAGIRIKSKPNAYGPWDYGVELMYQFGTINSRNANGTIIVPVNTPAVIAAAPEQRQDAYAAIAQLGYTWTESAYQPRLALIYSYASGDKNRKDGVSNTFQNQFATTHLFYGYMDFNSLQNIHDIRLAYTIKPTPTTTLALEAHQQYLASTSDYWYNVGGVARTGGTQNLATDSTAGTGYGINAGNSSNLGQEIDFVFGWSPLPYVNVEGGVCHYFRGDYIKESWSNSRGDSKDANYAYLQLTLNL
ncbi:MAG: alginate export family protein [Verrucomicrobia bacterium]|nr:alginate export family protein [Verrucomicrobiota bacterium]